MLSAGQLLVLGENSGEPFPAASKALSIHGLRCRGVRIFTLLHGDESKAASQSIPLPG